MFVFRNDGVLDIARAHIPSTMRPHHTVNPTLPSNHTLTVSNVVPLTLSVLAVLVAGPHPGVHAVAGGAVGGRAVGLGRGQAVHHLEAAVRPALAAARREGGGAGHVGAVQPHAAAPTAVERRDGEVVLRLRWQGVGVAEDAHHLETQNTQDAVSEPLLEQDKLEQLAELRPPVE